MTDMFIVAFNTRFVCLKNTPKAALSEEQAVGFVPLSLTCPLCLWTSRVSYSVV